MYWDEEECTSERNQGVCESRLNTFYFVVPTRVRNPDGETTNAAYTASAQFAAGYWNGQCLKGDYVDASMVFVKAFKPTSYPHEAHTLEVTLQVCELACARCL